MGRKYSPAEITLELTKYPEWNYEPEVDFVYSEFGFNDFDSAVNFIVTIKDLCNSINHYPSIYLYGYKYVRLELRTIEAEGVTDADFKLAGLIDELFNKSISAQAVPQEQVEQQAVDQLADQLQIPNPAIQAPSIESPSPTVPNTNPGSDITLQPEEPPTPSSPILPPNPNSSPAARPVLPPS